MGAAKRTVGKQSRQAVKRRGRDTGPSAEVTARLWVRARGRCELCGRDLTVGAGPWSRHHRRPRGMGGSTLDWVNELPNLLLLCGDATSPDGCHHRVEANRVIAYEQGWLIRSTSPYLPVEVPVFLPPVDRHHPVYLSVDGAYVEGSP